MRTLWLVLVSGLLAAAPVCLAQQAPETPDAAQEQPQAVEAPSDVEEITVTGERSQITDVQGEAKAISAFSMEDLDRANIVTVDQLAFNVPALHVGQLGADSIITLRGIGTENATVTGEPGLAFHVDGVNYARPAAARVAFFDLEGVQVLRGPQGSQGGKNATAGWIHAVTRKPHDDFEAQGDVQWGSYDQRRIRAALNIPINEYAQTRFALFREERDGFQENLLFNDEDRDGFDADDLGLRGHLRLLPLPDLEALFTYNYFKAEGVGAIAEVVGLPPATRCNPIPPPFGTGYNPRSHFPSFAGCGADPARGEFAASGYDLDGDPQFRDFENPATRGRPRSQLTAASRTPHQLFLDEDAGQDNSFWGWTTTLRWDAPELPLFGFTEFKSITAYQVADLDLAQDADGSDLFLLTGSRVSDTDQWSQELQWIGSLGENVDFQLSGFWLREKSDSELDFEIRLGVIQPLNIDQKTENTSMGLALSTTWALRDDLSLTLGGRYTRDEKRNKLFRNNPPQSLTSFGSVLSVCTGGAVDLLGTPAPIPGNPNNQRGNGVPDDGIPWCEQTFRQTTGDATLEWWANDQNLFYARVANGFKSGGFAAFEFGTYDPEYIWSFALGSKSQLFDDRLTLNLEGFFYNYRDLQLVLVDGLSVRTDNADAEVLGVDLEFDGEPIPGLRLNGNVSYLDTEITDYEVVDPVESRISALCKLKAINPRATLPAPGCQLTDWSGNELSRAPEWSLTLGAEYDILIGRFGTLTPRVQYYWQDDTWFRPFNRTLQDSGGEIVDQQDSYNQTDIKLVWLSPSERWTAEAFVTNVEDEVVYQNLLVGSALLDNPLLAWYGPPRQYGFRVGFRY